MLGLGIGTTVTLFSIVQGVLLDPLPFERGEELVSLRRRAPGMTPVPVGLSQPTYFTYVESNRSFRQLGLWRPGQAVVSGRDRPEQVNTLEVTRSLLELLQVHPAPGRIFSAEEDRPGADGLGADGRRPHGVRRVLLPARRASWRSPVEALRGE